MFARYHHACPRVPATSARSFKHLAALAGSLILFHAAAYAGTVFTSNFSNPNNDGQIGGGLLTGSASDVNINQGPWQGTYHGIAGVLAPPTVAITPGAGTIGGIVGVNLPVLGLTNNYGWFFQDTGATYQANTQYTLTADIDAGGLLSASLLSNDGVGIGLTAGGDSLIGASTDPGAFLSLSLLSGNVYQMSYSFVTGSSAPSGDIGIRLFDRPSGLLTANLLSGVTFSNVSLNASATPEPASLGLAGGALILLGLSRRARGRAAAPVKSTHRKA